MELIAEQDWVREQCSKQDSRQLLDTDKLGDASLSPAQVRGLIPLISIISGSVFLSPLGPVFASFAHSLLPTRHCEED